MSYINYNSKRNSLIACTQIAKFYEEEPESSMKRVNENYSELRRNGDFAGVQLENFLSKLELDGLRCEEKFKDLLESNNVPFLYIGQGPFGIERSGILLEQMKSKRADFIVNIPNIGTLLFDVKCRKRLGFKGEGMRFFALYVSEVEALYNLHCSILMPVWLAFFDRADLKKNKEGLFYLVPISWLYAFWQEMLKERKELADVKVMRIPDELLTPVKDGKISFGVGYAKMDDDLVKTFADRHAGYQRWLKDKIKQTIREDACYKTHLPKKVAEKCSYFVYQGEVGAALEGLIKSKTVIYEPYEALKMADE